MQLQLQHPRSLDHGLDRALDRLATVARAADEWVVRLPTERDPSLEIAWRSAGSHHFRSELLNSATGEPVKLAETLGGRLFYSFHFTLMLPGFGYWIVGAAAMFMLVAKTTLPSPTEEPARPAHNIAGNDRSQVFVVSEGHSPPPPPCRTARSRDRNVAQTLLRFHDKSQRHGTRRAPPLE
jgi:hypothetical protein